MRISGLSDAEKATLAALAAWNSRSGGGGEGLVWAANKAEWAEAAEFFARVIAADPSYISHGEMQTGLSPDGKTWASGLEQRFLAELGRDDERGLAIVRGACGKIVAAANVTWCFETADAPFATLQDMAVEPAMRMAGLGARLLRFVEDEALRRGAKWIFLESGKSNHGAHAFFAREGFVEISHVYVRPCLPEPRSVMPSQEAAAANGQEGA